MHPILIHLQVNLKKEKKKEKEKKSINIKKKKSILTPFKPSFQGPQSNIPPVDQNIAFFFSLALTQLL